MGPTEVDQETWGSKVRKKQLKIMDLELLEISGQGVN